MRDSSAQASLIPPVPAVLIAMIAIQGGAAQAKVLFESVGPLGAVGLRVTIAAILLWLINRRSLGNFNRASWLAVLPYGAALGLMNLTFYLSLERLPLGLAVTLEFIGPLGVAVAGSRRPVDLLWVGFALAGILLMSPLNAAQDADPLGVCWALAAGGFWALYIVSGQRVFERGAVTVGMLFAAVITLPFGVAHAGLKLLEPSVLALGAIVAVLSSALPYSLEMIALRALPARVFSILLSLEPAIAALIGLVFLREMLTPTQWIAVGSVLCASIGATLTARPAAESGS
jgi:inner membrane transporter RhtA